MAPRFEKCPETAHEAPKCVSRLDVARLLCFLTMANREFTGFMFQVWLIYCFLVYFVVFTTQNLLKIYFRPSQVSQIFKVVKLCQCYGGSLKGLIMWGLQVFKS